MSNATVSLPVSCPNCHRPTGNLKQYRVIQFILFLGIAAAGRAGTYTMCPGCMRGRIVKNALVNVFTAHIAFPILLPFFAVQFLRTFTKGHSAGLRKEIDAIFARRAQALAA